MKRLLLFLTALLTICGAARADIIESLRSLWKEPPTPLPKIKVLIAHDLPSATLEVKGKYTLEDPHTNHHLSTRHVGKSQVIQAIPGGLKWGEEFPGIHQIEVKPSSAETEIFVNGVPYRGSIQIYSIGRTISIVEELSVEQYLSYLLPLQYPQELPDEVLAALVIASRTNAFHQALFPKSKFWGVEGKQIGYKGIIPVDGSSPIQKALKNTRDMVMSQTGAYERIVTPFAVQWEAGNPKAVTAQISIAEAVDMSKKGAHAAIILDKAFPRMTIQLMH